MKRRPRREILDMRRASVSAEAGRRCVVVALQWTMVIVTSDSEVDVVQSLRREMSVECC